MFLIFAIPMILGSLALLSRSRHHDYDRRLALAAVSGADYHHAAHPAHAAPHPYTAAHYRAPYRAPHHAPYGGPHDALYHTAAHYGAPHYGAPTVPSPLVVFNNMISVGQIPPPQVILCAIAEAETLGQMALAHQIFQTYVLPVVAAAERDAAVNARYAGPAPAPAYQTAPAYPAAAPQYDAPQYDDGADYGYADDPTYAQAQQAYQQAPYQQQAPAGQAGQQEPPAGRGQADQATARAAQAVRATQPTGDRMSPADEAAFILQQARAMSGPDDRATVTVPETDGGRDDAPTSASGTITVSGKSSPIAGVGTDEWGRFVGSVSRELPTYTSDRHVGQFRQSRSRLAELGINPESVVGSPDAQAAALELDMSDAYHHAAASGMLDEFVGTVVVVPVSGQARPVEVSASGVLGVIQAAGLEGAAGWLHDERDRRRFGGTTQAFLRTNGAF